MKTTTVWETLQTESSPGTGRRLWEQLKELLDFSKYVPQPREGVISKKFEGKDETYYVLKSPTGQYIKIDPASYFLWSQMNGTKSVADLAVAYFMEYFSFAFGRLRTLITSLRNKGFLEEPPANVYGQVAQQLQENKVAGWGGYLAQTLIQREFPIRGLDASLTRLYKGGVWFFFTKPMVWLYWIIAIAGLGLFGSLVIRGDYSFASVNNSVGLGILSLYIGLFVTIMLHESAHAFTVKHYGRQVHRGGAMIYFGSLAFFVDTQDIWLADKKARIATSWAGPFMNLIVGGVLASVIFVFPGFSLNSLLFKIAAVTYLNALFNINPLIELDGYFILMDWLEVPSLRQRSFGFLRQKLLSKIKQREPFSARERVFLIFGLLAGVYTAFTLVMVVFVLRQRLVPLLRDWWSNPGLWGKLLVGVMVLMVFVPLMYSLLRRLIFAFNKSMSWLNARGVFASKRNVAWSLLLPVVLCHFIPWVTESGLWIIDLCRLVFLGLGIGAILVIWRSYDHSYLQRALLALGLPLLAFTGAECLRLASFLNDGAVLSDTVAHLQAVGLGTFLAVAYLTFETENVKLASPLERGLTALLLPTGVVMGVLLATGLLIWGVPPLTAIATGIAVGVATISLALMISLVASFWYSQLRYTWLYVVLALGILGIGVVWDTTPLASTDTGGIGAFVLALGYSFLSGGIVLYYLTQTQAYAQLRPVEAELDLSVHEQLTMATQHLVESMLAQYHHLFGDRRLRALQDAINILSASARWGVVIDRGHLVISKGLQDVEPSHLALTYRQLLAQTIASLQRRGGRRFAKQTLQRAYDSLPWESRELAGEYILQDTTWGGWLSRRFKEKQLDYKGLLKRIPIFFHCTSQELDAICARLKERTFAPGEVIIRQGDLGDAFYVVKSGKVAVWQQDEQGWDRLVNEHSREGTFGELALLHDAPRNATCIATTPTTTLVLKREAFQLVRHYFDVEEKVEQSINYVRILKNIPLFAETSTERLKEIATCLKPESLEAGEVFLQQGETGDKFYIIQEGEVEVFTLDPEGQEKVVARRRRGEYVGEIALLRDIPRTASVRTVTQSTLLTLSRDEFLELMAQDLEIQQSLGRVSSRRVHRLRRHRSENIEVVAAPT